MRERNAGGGDRRAVGDQLSDPEVRKNPHLYRILRRRYKEETGREWNVSTPDRQRSLF